MEEAAAQPAPTYPDKSVTVEEARAAVRRALSDHLAAEAGCRAIKVSTGVGKTRIAVEVIAEAIRRQRGEEGFRPYFYAVPTHKLGDEVAALFREAGVSARVFRGRKAGDPDAADPEARMCLDYDAVELALELGREVKETCCEGIHPNLSPVRCPLFATCGYQRQLWSAPEVWIGAHPLLFSMPGEIGDFRSVFIDESFWAKGVKLGGDGLRLDRLGEPPPIGRTMGHTMTAADLGARRALLARALRQQEELGGVLRRTLAAAGLTAEKCSKAAGAEYLFTGYAQMWPGMGREARERAAEAAGAASESRRYASIWRAARRLLASEDEDAVSGHLVIEVDGRTGARAVKVRGVREILAALADVPTFIMDATLPDLGILRTFYPGVEVVADIEARAPHATARQVLGAPVSSGKLLRSEAGRNREEVRRAILIRWARAGRPPCLVIVQKQMEDWLRQRGLPDGIEVAHFNAVAGLDGFKGVGVLFVIGRTMPSVLEAEAFASAIGGTEGVKTPQPEDGPRWYERTPLALRMSDGSGQPIIGDRHPDPIAEGARWQVAEAEVLQAIGRARAVNRTRDNPVAIEVWNDLALPLTVDEAVPWSAIPSGYEAELMVDGMALASPGDLSACWPQVWATPKAAERWRGKTTAPPNPIESILYREWGACGPLPDPAPFRYQHKGERQKWRLGWYLPDIVPDPLAWLEQRLGIELARFEYLPDEPVKVAA